MEVPPDTHLESLLKYPLICYFKDGFDMKRSMRELETKGIDNLASSRFDSIACVLSKVQGQHVTPIDEYMKAKVGECFKTVIPWNRSIKLVIHRRFKIIRIPLHLCNDLTIERIGSTLGEVVEIYNIRHTFDTAEVTVSLNESRIMHKSLKIIEGSQSFQVWIQEVKKNYFETSSETSSEFEITSGRSPDREENIISPIVQLRSATIVQIRMIMMILILTN